MSFSGSPAHPRSRGENRIRRKRGRCPSGSSPLTRGKLRPQFSSSTELRLIPAHAGKTGRCMCGVRHGEAHPRSRGENVVSIASCADSPGSSPLTRGKRTSGMSLYSDGRLIPAHAGKTAAAALRGVRLWAHPRSRGENPWKASQAYSRAGSSPLTRGKRLRRNPHRPWRGLIPAHAGKTN